MHTIMADLTIFYWSAAFTSLEATTEAYS